MVGNRLPTTVKPSHYSIVMTPRPAEREELGFEQFEAIVQISVDIVEATDRILLNNKGLGIGDCTFTIPGNQTLKGQTRLIQEKEQLEIVFLETLSAGTRGVLRIVYDGKVTTNSVGIYQNSYNGGKRLGIATQMEQADCRAMVPCWDEPAFKATFDLTVTVPSFYTVLFNSELDSSSESAPGLTTHVFKSTPSMSTYLLALFVGEADVIQNKSKSGVDVRVWTPVGQTDLGKFQLDVAVKCLDFFEEFYGYKYVLPKVDLIGLDTFVFGGMENWGLITFTASVFYFDPESASDRLLHTAAYIIGHELAHMWFGNLVTMTWWNDLWLNEGFATYAGWLATRQCFPEWDLDSIVYSREGFRALSVDASKSTHAVCFDESIDDIAVITTLVDTITYAKGFSALVLAASFCGEANFAAGVRAYIQKHAYGNTVTSDLFDALSKACGKDVTGLIGKWTTMVGYPVVHINRVKDELHVSQQRYLSNGERMPLEEPWPIPLRIFWGKGQTEFLFDTEKATFKLPLAAADASFLLVDPGQTTMIQVVYSAGMWQNLTKHSSQLAPVDRLGLLASRVSLSMAGYVPSSEVLRLIDSFAETETSPFILDSAYAMLADSFFPVWSKARGGALKSLMSPLQSRLHLVALKLVGEKPRAGESRAAAEARDKGLKIQMMADKSNPRRKEYLDLFPKWQTLTASKLSVVLSLALQEASLGWEAVEPIWRDGDAVPSQTAALSLSRSALPVELKFRVLKELPSGQVFHFVTSFREKVEMWNFIKSDWDHLSQAMGGQGNPLTRMVSTTLSDLSDLSLCDEIDAFEESLGPRDRVMLGTTLIKAKAGIRQNHGLIERDFETMKALLTDSKEAQSPLKRGRASSLPRDEGRSGTSAAIAVAETVLGVALVGALCYGAYRFFASEESN